MLISIWAPYCTSQVVVSLLSKVLKRNNYGGGALDYNRLSSSSKLSNWMLGSLRSYPYKTTESSQIQAKLSYVIISMCTPVNHWGIKWKQVVMEVSVPSIIYDELLRHSPLWELFSGLQNVYIIWLSGIYIVQDQSRDKSLKSLIQLNCALQRRTMASYVTTRWQNG